MNCLTNGNKWWNRLEVVEVLVSINFIKLTKNWIKLKKKEANRWNGLGEKSDLFFLPKLIHNFWLILVGCLKVSELPSNSISKVEILFFSLSFKKILASNKFNLFRLKFFAPIGAVSFRTINWLTAFQRKRPSWGKKEENKKWEN